MKAGEFYGFELVRRFKLWVLWMLFIVLRQLNSSKDRRHVWLKYCRHGVKYVCISPKDLSICIPGIGLETVLVVAWGLIVNWKENPLVWEDHRLQLKVLTEQDLWERERERERERVGTIEYLTFCRKFQLQT